MPLSLSGSVIITGSLNAPVPVQNVSAQGTDNTTTTILSYGVNVISASNSSDFCAILPAPSIGRTVTVVNTAGYKTRIFASGSGTINGQVGGYFEIQPDDIANNFVCYENPLPGGWSTTQRQNPTLSTLTYPDMSINHVSGTTSFYAGVGVAYSGSSFGSGINGNYRLVLYPTASAPAPTYATFTTEAPNVVTATTMRVYTNITSSDIPSYDNNPNGPTVAFMYLGSAYLTAPNGSTSGQRSTVEMLYPETILYYWNTVVGGIQNTPLEIGDRGTLYKEEPVAGGSIGSGSFSPYYYTFVMRIGAAFPTKTYKFRFELDTV